MSQTQPLGASLRPRLLPDKQFAFEWGDLGALRVLAIRKGLRVPPTATFGMSQVCEWLGDLPEELVTDPTALSSLPMPEHWPAAIATMKQILTGNQDWPIHWKIGSSWLPQPHARVEGWDSEASWRAFVEVVRLSWGALPLELRRERRGFSSLVQPVIDGVEGQEAAIVREHAILAPGHWGRTVSDGETTWWVDFGTDDLVSRLSSVKHLLIDLDDTLVEAPNRKMRLRLSLHAWRRLARSLGWRRAYTALREGTNEVKRHIDPSEPLAPTNAARVNERVSRALGVPAHEIEPLLEDAIRQSFPRVLELFTPVPGASELMASTRGHYRHTLATNPVWTEETVRLRLGRSGVDTTVFERVTHSKSMVACKPAARYYRDVLKLVGIEDPSEALMIGDSPVLDLPASAIGIPTVLVDSKRSSHDLTLDKLGDHAWQGSYAATRWALARARELGSRTPRPHA